MMTPTGEPRLAGLSANRDFVEGFASKFRPLLMTQEVKLLQAAPSGPHHCEVGRALPQWRRTL